MNTLRWLDAHLEQLIIVVVSALMIAMLSAQVFSRYVFNLSISWSEELSIFGMVWLTYFGASYAIKTRRHIRITILPDLCSPPKRKLMELAVNVVFLCFLLLLIYGSVNMTSLAHATGQRASASGFPRWIAIAGLPLAFSLSCLRLVQDMVKLIAEYKILAAGGTLQDTETVISIRLED